MIKRNKQGWGEVGVGRALLHQRYERQLARPGPGAGEGQDSGAVWRESANTPVKPGSPVLRRGTTQFANTVPVSK